VRSRASTLNPVCGFVAILLLTPPAQAASWIEFFDAGETLETAQAPGGGGPWDFIDAFLEDLGGGVDDVDLWKILVVDPDAFSVSVSADLSEDNDAAMWLFDSDGFIVGGENFPNIFPGFDDRAPGDCELPSSPCLPEFFPGDFAGGEPGIYYLGFSLFATAPVVGPGLPLSGWDRDPFPFQTGSYDLTMTGVNFIPIPAAAWLFGSALGLLGWLKRRAA
jgi:hypothetical protein